VDINSIFLDVLDRISPEMNGSLTIQKFNRISKIGELNLLGWLTGSISSQPGYPEPYTTQKNKDFVAPILKTEKRSVVNGVVEKFSDYYMWERAAILGDRIDEVDGEQVTISEGDTPIELLDSAMFDARTKTHIESLRPSVKKPICKLVGNEFHFLPKDIGSIAIEYKRLPVFGELKSKIDEVYNNEVVDESASADYEWGEGLRTALVFFICEQYPIGTREVALQQQIQAVGKTATP
jgi:hypothetical protein